MNNQSSNFQQINILGRCVPPLIKELVPPPHHIDINAELNAADQATIKHIIEVVLKYRGEVSRSYVLRSGNNGRPYKQ